MVHVFKPSDIIVDISEVLPDIRLHLHPLRTLSSGNSHVTLSSSDACSGIDESGWMTNKSSIYFPKKRIFTLLSSTSAILWLCKSPIQWKSCIDMLLGSTPMNGMTYFGNLVCDIVAWGRCGSAKIPHSLLPIQHTHVFSSQSLILKSQYYCSGYDGYSCHVDNGNYSQYRQASMKSTWGGV